MGDEHKQLIILRGYQDNTTHTPKYFSIKNVGGAGSNRVRECRLIINISGYESYIKIANIQKMDGAGANL